MFKKIFFLLVVLVLSSCAPKVIRHDYSWVEYKIAPDRVTAQIDGENCPPLKIIKGISETTEKRMGNVGLHEYYGNNQLLTNAIADQLKWELTKRGLKISDTAEKSIELNVIHTAFERGMWKIASNLDFTVTMGGSKTKNISVRNSSPATVDLAYNGAVALAVIEILNDPEIASYINEQ